MRFTGFLTDLKNSHFSWNGSRFSSCSPKPKGNFRGFLFPITNFYILSTRDRIYCTTRAKKQPPTQPSQCNAICATKYCYKLRRNRQHLYIIHLLVPSDGTVRFFHSLILIREDDGLWLLSSRWALRFNTAGWCLFLISMARPMLNQSNLRIQIYKYDVDYFRDG